MLDVGETEKAISRIERLLTVPFAVDYADESITLADLRQRWEWDPLASIRDFKKFLPAPSPPLRTNNGPLLFGKLRFLQQESLHIGEDKARVECAGTVNVPDATFAID